MSIFVTPCCKVRVEILEAKGNPVVLCPKCLKTYQLDKEGGA